MAFAQQHRRPHNRTQQTFSSDSEELGSAYHRGRRTEDLASTSANLVLSPRPIQPVSSSNPSDSENDWHVISSALPSPPARHGSCSSVLEPSEPESFSSFRPSDTESFSDVDIHSSVADNATLGMGAQTIVFSNLPAHDGTGTFADEPGFCSDNTTSQDEADSPTAFARVVQRMLHEQQQQQQFERTADEHDFEPDSESMPNILLPHGGIRPPSFVHNQPYSDTISSTSSYPITNRLSPAFKPTVTGHDSQLSATPSSAEERMASTVRGHDARPSDESTESANRDIESFTQTPSYVRFSRKRRSNLDRHEWTFTVQLQTHSNTSSCNSRCSCLSRYLINTVGQSPPPDKSLDRKRHKYVGNL
ncbi:hypothetical protein DFQ28_005082 [Apophysomyces sp. BC1034]|nr:hypothetical protein DFQ30_010423 [Apophysomyces sp. BC1015]KAG0193478.1 hypothetical protein DFQ28_005082 [Apophysomyces sp. BC1034]